jgi:hypothetical protein
MLPDGLTDSDLIQAGFQIPNILEAKSTLLRTSLVFVDASRRLKVLVPIREYTLRIYPPTIGLKRRLHRYFHELLDLWDQFKDLNVDDIGPHISRSLGNFHSVFQDALNTDDSDIIQNARSILFLNRLYRSTQGTYSPLLPRLAEKMPHWRDKSIFGDYLIQLFESASTFAFDNAEAQMRLGNEYFQSKDPLEQGMMPSVGYASMYIDLLISQVELCTWTLFSMGTSKCVQGS